MKPILLFLLVVAASAKYVALPAPFEDYCILQNKTNRYDASKQFDFPWFNVDLDQPPSQRWHEISTTYKKQIAELIGVLIDFITPIFPDAVEVVDLLGADLENRLPQPYRDEIKSIADDTGIPMGQIVMYNIFYEIFTVCTSIVATDNKGDMYHARNLDFGLFMGWDPVQHEWPITQKLRQMIINVNWIKDGKVLYKSNNFAGYVGIYNGMKQNGFTITANDRFLLQGGYVGIYRWLTGLEPNGKFMSWLTRETFENYNTFEDAKQHLMTTEILAPVYFILGGVKPFDGVIIARSLEGTDIVTPMNASDPNGWFILETNYDQGKPVLYLDDRRTPGDHCMKVMGRKNAGFEGIFNVLSSRSTLNKLTAYSVLMQASTGRFETITQSCPGNCWPW